MPLRIGAPPYFGQMFFNDTEDADGWSEGYYISGVDDGYASALDALNDLMAARLGLITEEIECVGLRISDATVKNDTVVDLFSDVERQFGSFGVAGDRSLPSDDCIFYRQESAFIAGVPAHVTRPLHGLPRKLEDDDRDRLFLWDDPDWQTAWTDFVAKMTDLTWVVKKDGESVIARRTLSLQAHRQIRDRKVGRPFGLFRGRTAR